MIGVIADDLTGAAEIGAVGLRHGLSAEIIHAASGTGRGLEFRVHAAGAGKPAEAGTSIKSRSAGLICINTDSRSCSPAVAGRRAAAAARALAAAGAEWIYKKTDSVLRGPVVAELEAILKQLELELALLLPANPSSGRTIRGGRYCIRGRPIHETDFARDPEHPRRSSEVRALLGKPRRSAIHVCPVRAALPASGIALAEAATAGEVRHWAARRTAGLLPAGGAEYFAALLAATGHTAAVRGKKSAVARKGRELFVSGSASESARQFVEANRRRGVPVFGLPAGAALTPAFIRNRVREISAAFRSQLRIILNVGLPPVRSKPAAARLTVHLARIAAAVQRQVEVSRLFAEGGATAMELIRQTGWERLKVQREEAPGVATLAVEGSNTLLTIKPGSYAWPASIRAT